MNLRPHQCQIAGRLRVVATTLYNWEHNRVSPILRAIPKIVEFLEYAPGLFKATTLEERIRMTRKLLGLSQKQVARNLRIDPSTLGWWEKDQREPSRKLKKRLEEFWSSDSTQQKAPTDLIGALFKNKSEGEKDTDRATASA